MPSPRLLYTRGELQLAAADGVGPVSEQVGPVASGSLGVNEHEALLPVTAHATGANVGVAVAIVNVAVELPETPLVPVPETVNV